VIVLKFQYYPRLLELANWLILHDGGNGTYARDDQVGRLVGNNWRLFHTTVDYNVVTKAEFDNEELAAMFALRWLG